MKLFSRALTFVRSPTAVYLGASVLARLGAIVLVPLYARRLSREEYGDYTLAQSLTSLVPAILTLGLIAAVSRAFFGEKDRTVGLRAAGDIALWSLAACSVLGSLTILSLFVVPFGNGHGLFVPHRLALVIAAGIGSSLTTVPSVLMRSSQQPFKAAAFQLAEFLSVALLGILFVGVLHRGFDGSIEALFLAYVLNGLFAAWYVIGPLGGRLRRATLRRLLPFSLPFVPHFIASWLQQMSDRWTMRFDGFEADVGAYAMAGQVVSPMAMTTLAWNDNAQAQLGERFRSEGLKGLAAAFRPMARRYLLSGALPGALVLLLLPLIPLVVGSKFVDVVWMAPALLVIALIDTQFYPAQGIIYFADHTRIIPVVTMAAALCNVGCNILLVHRYGVKGALLSRFITITGRAIALYVAAKIVLRRGARRAAVGDGAKVDT